MTGQGGAFGGTMKIQALFWDNDGILVDTEPLYFQATAESLREIGIDLTESHYRSLSLTEGRSSFDLAVEQGLSPETVTAMIERRNRRYTELLRKGVLVMDGVEEALAALSCRLTMGIVTSSRRVHFEVMHQGTGRLLSHFAFTLTREDYQRSKPNPEPYRLALSRVGLPPEACLAIEDSPRGLESAVAAGLRCIVVPNALTRGSDFTVAWRVLSNCREILGEIAAVNG